MDGGGVCLPIPFGVVVLFGGLFLLQVDLSAILASLEGLGFGLFGVVILLEE